MQISFLKDFATLRNPASPFTFLQYAKAKGRLEQFINLREFHPTRFEYHDYMSWVAEAFAGDVRYGTAVTRVMPLAELAGGPLSLFRIEAHDLATGERSEHYARNIVYAAGGKPRLPTGRLCTSPAVLHSSRFLPHFPAHFDDHGRAWEFAVAGDGQSAGEVVEYILRHYERARVHLFLSGYSLRATDSSPFVNEQFYSRSAAAFHELGEETRAALREELRGTNYGVVDPDLIGELYRLVYRDEVRGERRFFLHPFSRLAEVQEESGLYRVSVDDRFGGPPRSFQCDGVVLATGYDRSLDPVIFADVLPLLERSETGELQLSSHCRVQTDAGLRCGVYVQGYGEASFGLGDTLLSLLPFRSRDIFNDIRERASAEGRTRRPVLRLAQVEYPPKHHIEEDREKLYAVMERFRFATLISVSDGEPVVTHVPMTLDRSRGAHGVLFGHMDRANPHVELLDGRPVRALFHGPNAFISPHVYETSQLPTWNSITVHVRGHARVLEDRDAVVRGLCGIPEHVNGEPGAYRLSPDDPRIGRLIEYIVGFEIEIDEMVGRFKLSQDRNESDRRLAALELARRTEEGERALVERVVGLPLTGESAAEEPSEVLAGPSPLKRRRGEVS